MRRLRALTSEKNKPRSAFSRGGRLRAIALVTLCVLLGQVRWRILICFAWRIGCLFQDCAMTDMSSGDQESGEDSGEDVMPACHFCKRQAAHSDEWRTVAIDGKNSRCCYSCAYTCLGRKPLLRIIPRDDGVVWLLLFRTGKNGSELPVAHRLDPSEIFHCTEAQVKAMIVGFQRIVLAVYGTECKNPAERYRDAKRRGIWSSVANALSGNVSDWLFRAYGDLVHDHHSVGLEEYVTRENATRRVTSRRIQRDARTEERELEAVRVAIGVPREIAELVCSYVAPLVSAAQKAMKAAKAVYDKKVEAFEEANGRLSEHNRADDMAAHNRRWEARARRAQSALVRVGAKRKAIVPPPPEDSDYDSYSDMELARATKRASVTCLPSSPGSDAAESEEEEEKEETAASKPRPNKTAARTVRRGAASCASSST